MTRSITRALLILAAVAMLAACGGNGGNGGDERPQRPSGGPPGGFGGFGGFAGGGAGGQRAPTVEAVEVLQGTLPLEERLSGSVRARNQTEIYAEVSGPIVEVLANDGDRVDAGAPLVRLRSTDFEERLRQAESGLQVAQARVRQTEAQLTRVQATLDRIETLAERGLASTAELDNARADVLTAQADLELMQAQRDQAASQVAERRAELGDTVVRAPISGVVGGRNAEVGQQVTSGSRLFVIGDTSGMRVRVTLTERMLGYIDTGTNVHVFSDARPDEPIRASITRISPFLHPVTHSTEAEIEIDAHDGALRPGMFVTVDVLYGESAMASLVPNSAIYRHPRDGRQGVYVTSMDADTLRGAPDPELLEPQDPESPQPLEGLAPQPVSFVPIEIVARGRLVSGVSGVDPGDWVVTLGHHLLSTRDLSEAVIHPTPWDHVINLQQMQSRDLLEMIERRQAEGGTAGTLN